MVNVEAKTWPLLILLGPTGMGKSDMALRLAAFWPLEVVNADSRQIYRYLNVGTAKPTPQQRSQVPHHLYDICEPDRTLTLAEYQTRAHECIRAIRERNNLPILVGGTPLYLRAIRENLRIPEVAPDPDLRQELESVLEEEGVQVLFDRLAALDPATANSVDPYNGRRIIRALEVYIKTGQSKVQLEGQSAPEWPICSIGLNCPREILHERVDVRVDDMMKCGLAEEVKSLVRAGYDAVLPALSALGYRQLLPYVAGTQTLEEAVTRIKSETHRYIRHQYTWFRRWHNIRWFEMDFADPDRVAGQVQEFVEQEWKVRTTKN